MDLVAALLEEKERVSRAGLLGRVAQIDVQLAKVGYEVPKPKKTARKKTAERADVAAPERSVPERPQRRPSR